MDNWSKKGAKGKRSFQSLLICATKLNSILLFLARDSEAEAKSGRFKQQVKGEIAISIERERERELEKALLAKNR